MEGEPFLLDALGHRKKKPRGKKGVCVSADLMEWFPFEVAVIVYGYQLDARTNPSSTPTETYLSLLSHRSETSLQRAQMAFQAFEFIQLDHQFIMEEYMLVAALLSSRGIPLEDREKEKEPMQLEPQFNNQGDAYAHLETCQEEYRAASRDVIWRSADFDRTRRIHPDTLLQCEQKIFTAKQRQEQCRASLIFAEQQMDRWPSRKRVSLCDSLAPSCLKKRRIE